jgi:ribonucleotide monophosphatase NagD (HAD superfamily)
LRDRLRHAEPMTAAPSFIDRFAPLAADYDVVLSDVWGVVHNGIAAFPDACDALARFRAGGGTVLLITNAPRPQAQRPACGL